MVCFVDQLFNHWNVAPPPCIHPNVHWDRNKQLFLIKKVLRRQIYQLIYVYPKYFIPWGPNISFRERCSVLRCPCWICHHLNNWCWMLKARLFILIIGCIYVFKSVKRWIIIGDFFRNKITDDERQHKWSIDTPSITR